MPAAAAGFRFVDISAAAGLEREVLSGRPGKDHLLDSAGTGAAWLDADGDGWLDAFIVNGWRIGGDGRIEKGRHALYRNRGDGTFEDVTGPAGVDGGGQWGSGAAVADVDDDGHPDLLVTAFGSNRLYRNRGDGTFEDITERAGVAAPGWNTGAAFFDADGDGDLDLYLATYIDHTVEQVLEARATLNWKGMARVAVGPFGLDGAADRVFEGAGDGTFRPAPAAWGLEDRALAFGFAVVAEDLDGDGDTDVYVANDSDPNYLWRNEGGGRFTEVGLWTGAATDAGGAAQAGMGAAVGDPDGDGHRDLVVTNFAEDFSTLYRGEGGLFFVDASLPSGVGEPTFLPLSWGVAFADLDNDGDEDLVVANGHIYPQVDDHPEQGQSYGQLNQLLRNDGTGRFTDVTADAGPGFRQRLSSRGLALGDADNDGDLDLLFTHLDAPPTLLRNDSATGHWLTVVCVPAAGDGPLVGTRVTVRDGTRTRTRVLASSGSYLSVHDPRLHFGLGDTTVVERVEVLWPDGRSTVLRDVAADRYIRVRRDGTFDEGPGAP